MQYSNMQAAILFHLHYIVYEILERVKGGLSVRGYHLTLAKTSIADLHKTEKRFAIHVEEMLGCIGLPEYRQVIVEVRPVNHYSVFV